MYSVHEYNSSNRVIYALSYCALALILFKARKTVERYDSGSAANFVVLCCSLVTISSDKNGTMACNKAQKTHWCS